MRDSSESVYLPLLANILIEIKGRSDASADDETSYGDIA